MGFVIRATGGRVILIHVAKQNGYESCLLFSPEERSVKSVNKENVRGMQDDTISREQAIDAVNSRKTAEQSSAGIMRNAVVDFCVDIIKKLPPIQPKRGRWHYSDGKPARIGLSFGVVCDQCGTESEYCTNFCPNCGADMRGEQDG